MNHWTRIVNFGGVRVKFSLIIYWQLINSFASDFIRATGARLVSFFAYLGYIFIISSVETVNKYRQEAYMAWHG
jgi:hypothetical protein